MTWAQRDTLKMAPGYYEVTLSGHERWINTTKFMHFAQCLQERVA
jgi:hypothetical protein